MAGSGHGRSGGRGGGREGGGGRGGGREGGGGGVRVRRDRRGERGRESILGHVKTDIMSMIEENQIGAQ